jgi:hypothetical protein
MTNVYVSLLAFLHFLESLACFPYVWCLKLAQVSYKQEYNQRCFTWRLKYKMVITDLF